MKNIKRILMVALILCIILLIGACGKSTKENDESLKDSKDSQDSGSNYVVGFCNYTVSNSWQTQMEAEFKYACERLIEEGVLSKYYITNADGDANKQISDFKDLMTKKCDAIIITAASASALSPVCEEAVDEGIVVVSFDSLVDTSEITGKVSCNDVEFGEIGAQFIADSIGGKGKIAMLDGIAGSTCSEGRTEGAMNIFNKYPDIEIVNQTNADWDYAKAKVVVEGLLNSGIELDAIWSQGGAMTQAAVDAFNEAGKSLIPMSGEASNGFLKVWKENLDNGFSSICPGYPTYISEVALEQAIRALNGETIEDLYVLPSGSIGDEDIDDYYNPELPDSYWVITHLTDEQVKEIFK
ncbi:MAG TPA: ABC transporter substrate-binding protein [Clostridiaceae bacterium]|nr:ABC transporter substrate-binding protein [Clostridiaceae bacterium]